jgi:SNF2 family DNA or RNA helicase
MPVGEGKGRTKAIDNENWIPKETMSGILPNNKPAEYQLLGVNWMASLNWAKFGTGKMLKNVRGNSANEIGLRKTIQSITFLAWLNHQNQGGINGHIIHTQ